MYFLQALNLLIIDYSIRYTLCSINRRSLQEINLLIVLIVILDFIK